MKKLEYSFFADLYIVHVVVWALAFGAGAVAQVLFSKNRLKLGVEYFGFAGAAIFKRPSWFFSGETPVDSWPSLLIYDKTLFGSVLKSSLIISSR